MILDPVVNQSNKTASKTHFSCAKECLGQRQCPLPIVKTVSPKGITFLLRLPIDRCPQINWRNIEESKTMPNEAFCFLQKLRVQSTTGNILLNEDNGGGRINEPVIL
jgi:hypothetical protein